MVICALSFLGLLSCATAASATFQIIVDTNTSTIDYEPPEAWLPSTPRCTSCPSPPSSVLLNGNGTFHNGTNIPPKLDNDDFQQPTSKATVVSQGSRKDDGQHGKDDGPDSDDPNFVPMPVSVTFRFTASSFVLHALVPTFILPSNSPSNTNISFMLDGISTGSPFIFTPTAHGIGFKDAEVLQLSGLDDNPHVIVGNLAFGSTFIVSYVNLTLKDSDNGQSSLSQGASQGSISNDRLATSAATTSTTAASSHSTSMPPITKKNVASFAAAVGSVVGVLSIIALSTCLSLCYRRRAYRRRDAQIRAEEEAAEIREYGARVQGPRPFRPRYFPGTVPPFNAQGEADNIPPPYEHSEHSVIITPLPPPPPPPPPPPIMREGLQVREVPSSGPISIAPVRTEPLSLRRSSVISLMSPSYSDLAGPATIDPGTTDHSGFAEEPESGDGSEHQSLPSRRVRLQQMGEIREDETSDNESGGLLSSEAWSRTPVQNGENAIVGITP